jgi:Fur family ferric uptake transcriptional regulator
MKTTKEKCDASDTLKKAGLSQTSHRKRILHILIHADTPLSVNDLLKQLDQARKMNKVTAYRILSSFRSEGIVREILSDHGVHHYEMACEHNPIHPHVYCRICRTMTCLPPIKLWHARDLIAIPSNFRIDDIHVHITGLCKGCQKK